MKELGTNLKAGERIAAATRLQPALLDRLTDHEPHKLTEPDDQRSLNKAQLRQCVLRDLAWLLNSSSMDAEVAKYPHAARSVVNFGITATAGQRFSEVDWAALEKNVRQAILEFEPRILPHSLEVHALPPEDLMHHHNMLAFELRCQIWAQPYPVEMLLRTRLDLESGQMQVDDCSVAK